MHISNKYKNDCITIQYILLVSILYTDSLSKALLLHSFNLTDKQQTLIPLKIKIRFLFLFLNYLCPCFSQSPAVTL